jgi:hypothetical protein
MKIKAIGFDIECSEHNSARRHLGENCFKPLGEQAFSTSRVAFNLDCLLKPDRCRIRYESYHRERGFREGCA